MDRLPEFLRLLFWDADFDRLGVPGHERYIIERVLELGDVPAVRWLMQRFPREQIVEALCNSRRLSRKSARFWALVMDVPLEQVRCLSRSSHQGPERIWRW